GSFEVNILLGKGDGSFQAPLAYALSYQPFGIAVGDFNGDGILDVAVGKAFGTDAMPAVTVLLGNGDGTFGRAQDYAIASNPLSIVVGDFNRDGIVDVAVAQGSGVSILLGRGDGSFQAAKNYAAGTGNTSLVAGDFNSDGATDLAVTNSDSGSMNVLLGNGDGTF